MQQSRPKNLLSIAQKVSVILRHEEGMNKMQLAREFACSHSQIRNILENRERYLNAWRTKSFEEINMGESPHFSHLLVLDLVTYECVQRARCYGLNINDDFICATYEEVAHLLKMANFQATKPWCEAFKLKYRIFDLDPSPYIDDPQIPRKSLEIEDIIRDLKDPNCKNFVRLPEHLPHDPLKNLGNYVINSEHGKENSTSNEAVLTSSKEGKNITQLKREYGHSQIQRIVTDKEKYLDEWRKKRERQKNSTCKLSYLLVLEIIVYERVQRARCYGLSVNDDFITETGQKVASLLKMSDFQATKSWREALKQKYKMCDLGPSPFFDDPEVPRKSLVIQDIIRELKDPNCKNFVRLPEYLPYDPLKNLENNIKNPVHDKQSSSSNKDLCSERTDSKNILESKKAAVMSDENIKTTDGQENEIHIRYAAENDDGNTEGIEIEVIIKDESDRTSRTPKGQKTSFERNKGHKKAEVAQTQHVATCEEAIQHLRPLEEFARINGDIITIGLVNQLEKIFKESMSIEEK